MSKLPRILMLHGGGVSADIFNLQAARLQRALQKDFRFVFVDAPFETTPGPGILPTFAGCGPYWRWDPEHEGQDWQKALREILETLDEEEDTPFEGVIAFSQGARIASGMLLDQQCRDREGNKEKTNTNQLRFAVFAGGTFPPMRLDPCADCENDPSHEIVKIPTVHVHGKHDFFLPESEKLAEICEDKETLSFDGGHNLPPKPEDIKKLGEMIKRAYRK